MLRDMSFNSLHAMFIRVYKRKRTPTLFKTSYRPSREKGHAMISQDTTRLAFSSVLNNKTPKQKAPCLDEFPMSSLCLIVSKVWDLYVTNVVLTGWWISRMNTDHTSLLFSWMVCLCDLVYITDAFARSTKRVFHSVVTMDLTLLFDYRSEISTFELFVTVLTSLTFVPYHFLVILDVDMFCVYFLLCMLRLARLWKSGRLNAVSTLSFMAKNGHLRISEQNKAHMKAKTGQRSQKDERQQSCQKQPSSGGETPQENHRNNFLAFLDTVQLLNYFGW